MINNLGSGAEVDLRREVVCDINDNGLYLPAGLYKEHDGN